MSYTGCPGDRLYPVVRNQLPAQVTALRQQWAAPATSNGGQYDEGAASDAAGASPMTAGGLSSSGLTADLAVVGAGPAGAATAITARAGARCRARRQGDLPARQVLR